MYALMSSFWGQADVRAYEYLASAKNDAPRLVGGKCYDERGALTNQRNAVLVRAGMALLSAVAPPELSTTTLVPTFARP
jgi:hypothetical protein